MGLTLGHGAWAEGLGAEPRRSGNDNTPLRGVVVP